jgi:LysM repeat protein
MVTVPAGAWRTYAGPAALLAAATITVALARPALRHHPQAQKAVSPPVHVRRERRTAYVVRAGDTLASIAVTTRVALPKLRRLNPNVTPTALFIGQRIRLR